MNRPEPIRRSVAGPTAETSMRIIEYGICILAVSAALLLGFVR